MGCEAQGRGAAAAMLEMQSEAVHGPRREPAIRLARMRHADGPSQLIDYARRSFNLMSIIGATGIAATYQLTQKRRC